MSTDRSSRITRRAVHRAALWSTPFLVVATAAPAIASSEAGPVPDDDADYYWNDVAEGEDTTLTPEGGSLIGHYAADIDFRGDDGQAPPPDGVLVVTVVFSAPVTLPDGVDGT